jgi:hypothetical protein
MDALKRTASEREDAEDLLRAARQRGSGASEIRSDAARGIQTGLGEQAHGVAVRVYPSSQKRQDAPGPGPKVQIIDELTKKVKLTQG